MKKNKGTYDVPLFVKYYHRRAWVWSFLPLLSSIQISGAAEDLLSAFKVFDKEGTGKITVEEVKASLHCPQLPLYQVDTGMA